MNRKQRRALAKSNGLKKTMRHNGPLPSDQPDKTVVIGICRSCSKQRELYLPGRICGDCIGVALLEAQRTSQQALIERLMAELDEEDTDGE